MTFIEFDRDQVRNLLIGIQVHATTNHSPVAKHYTPDPLRGAIRGRIEQKLVRKGNKKMRSKTKHTHIDAHVKHTCIFYAMQ